MKTGLAAGILTSLPGRYARALFDVAEVEGNIGSVGFGLRSLKELIQSVETLTQTLANPTIPHEEKADALVAICVAIKAPEILQSFTRQLVKMRRILYLPHIEEIYQNLVSEAKGEQRIEVISAHRLTSSQGELLKDKLKKVFPGNLNLTFANDSKVLGGIMIRIGSRVIDATLVTHLSQLATVMKGNA